MTLLQLQLRSRLNAWLQWIGQSQLQVETGKSNFDGSLWSSTTKFIESVLYWNVYMKFEIILPVAPFTYMG